MLFSGFFITSHLPYTGSLIEAVTDKVLRGSYKSRKRYITLILRLLLIQILFPCLRFLSRHTDDK